MRSVTIVIPAFNEADNVESFYRELAEILPARYQYELLFVDDGSEDETAQKIEKLHQVDDRVKLLRFSRNFGKELATTAGLHHASGDAILTMDADGQHPVGLVPRFLELWEEGKQVVVGVRQSNEKEGFVKRYGSRLFHWLFNRIADVDLAPGSTDFRLVDRSVQEAFVELPEANRITRGLIDWLGFERAYIDFHANPRTHGVAAYDTRKLLNLAMNTFVSLTFAPLYIFGYVGIIITILSLLVGSFVLVEQFLLGDPLGLNVTGSASLGILILFLVGIILISQWITSLYISRMYAETKRRPLYIVDRSRSIL